MNPSSQIGRRLLALAWLVVVAAVAIHQYRFWRAPVFSTDVIELLPETPEPVLQQATDRLLAATATSWVVLVGAEDWELGKRAAQTIVAVIDPQRQRLRKVGDADLMPEPYREKLVATRGALMTRASFEWLQAASEEDIGRRAWQQLAQPVGDGVTSWRDDPLGLLSEWVRERAQASRLRPRDGWLWLEDGGLQWVALPFAEPGTGFARWNEGANLRLLGEARERVAAELADQGAAVRILGAGAVLQAEAAADRASFEVSIIGTGSLLAVILLTWVTFGSLRPILLVSLSLAVGAAVALSVTQLLFGRVHLLTLVFGASLVGVAEDYGIHYFAARQGMPVDQRWKQLHQIMPGLWLALATSGIAYLALGLAPFPGLRQIAVFSCVGLAGAFLTVLCWFPWLDRSALRATAFGTAFARTLDVWPRWPRGRKGVLLAIAVLVVLVPGLLRLQSVDDLRLLQNAPESLQQEQQEVGRILGLASPAQMYLVSAESQESLLQAEESLVPRLAALVDRGMLGGYQALSEWIPSVAVQQRNIAATSRANQIARQVLSRVTGEELRAASAEPQLLQMQDGAAMLGDGLPVPAWQDRDGQYHSLILLQGVTRDSLAALADAAAGLPAVRWLDNTARYSGVLSRYRVRLAGLLLLGVAGVMVLLHWRYGAGAWRAYAPTLLGGFITLAFFGWAGIPMQLFVVLSLILLLGMGIDYGIFMLEHPGERAVWLAVAIAGISTLLAFGLLALSTTPALHAFGLGMLVGETSIWLLTPVFRARLVRA